MEAPERTYDLKIASSRAIAYTHHLLCLCFSSSYANTDLMKTQVNPQNSYFEV